MLRTHALTPSLSRGERGKAAEISFRVRGERLEAESESLDRRTLASIARRVFSLDVDLDVFARTIAGEPDLTRALAAGRGRILRAPTLFEDAVKILLTTNCSWAATKGMVSRLIALAGAQRRAFPSAGAIAAFSPAKLKARVRWVRQEYRRRFPGPRRTTDRAIARRYARYGVHRGLALWLDRTSDWHDEKDGSQAW